MAPSRGSLRIIDNVDSPSGRPLAPGRWNAMYMSRPRSALSGSGAFSRAGRSPLYPTSK